MSNDANSVQLAVIGAGPGGYAAAFMAADLGLKVALIGGEENPGGVCLYRGCIPSKALLHVASVIFESRSAAHWGVQFSAPRIDMDKLRSWKEDVVRKLTGGLALLARQRSVRYLRGRASFLDGRTITVERHDGGEELLVFAKRLHLSPEQSLPLCLRIQKSRGAGLLRCRPKKRTVPSRWCASHGVLRGGRRPWTGRTALPS